MREVNGAVVNGVRELRGRRMNGQREGVGTREKSRVITGAKGCVSKGSES